MFVFFMFFIYLKPLQLACRWELLNVKILIVHIFSNPYFKSIIVLRSSMPTGDLLIFP